MVVFIERIAAYMQTLFIPLGLLAATVCVVTLVLAFVLSSQGLMRWAKWAFFGAVIGLGGGQILSWVQETARGLTG